MLMFSVMLTMFQILQQ